MPSPVTPWSDFTPLTAKSLNLALYTSDGTSDNPNGIAAQTYRPVLFESVSRAISFGSAAGGSLSSMSSVAGTAPTLNGIAIYDTAGYYGQTSDQPGGTTFYEFTSIISGSSGDGTSPGGWTIAGHFAPMKHGSTQTAVGADLMQTNALYMSGSQQLPSSSQDNCPFFLDLVNSGLFTWSPAVSVYDSASAAVLNAVNLTDSSGETCRLYVVWSAAASSSSGEVLFEFPGVFNWTAPQGVIAVSVQAWGAGGGGGAGNASSGGVEFGGGGAGGGEFALSTLSVTPLNNYPVIVGPGGVQGTNPGGNGSAGGDSSFAGDAGNNVAHGGSGGLGATITADGIGGLGGTGAGGTHFPGGAGAAGQTALHGGGGGSSAGPAAAGNTATGAPGAAAPAGGGPGGAGGKALVSVVQSHQGNNEGFDIASFTFGSKIQAGNTVIACVYMQGTTLTNAPDVTLSDGTPLESQESQSFSGSVQYTVGIYSVSGVTGGQTGITVKGNGGLHLMILCQMFEVAGMGLSPNVDASFGNGGVGNDYSVTGVTHAAPDFWIGTVGSISASLFDINAPAPPWRSLTETAGANFFFGRLLSGYQIVQAPGTMNFSGTVTSVPHSWQTVVVAFTAIPSTSGSSPLQPPGGGGGAGLGLFDGAPGLDGKIALNWTGLTGSGYDTPSLPAPLSMWDSNSVTSASILNGNTGIKSVVDFLNSPPILRVHTNANQTVPTAASTTIALQNDSGNPHPPPPPPPQQLQITTLSLPDGSVGAFYSQVVQAIGGTLPYTWSVSVGLPNGLVLNGTTGTISGTPTAAVTGSFTVTVTDHAGAIANQGLSINIRPVSTGPVITTTSLPQGSVGAPYSAVLTATGGALPYVWSEVGAMPPPLVLTTAVNSTGLISGTPTTVVSDNIVVTVTDNNNATNSLSFTIGIVAGLIVTTPGTLNAVVGTPFSVTLSASGGTPSYTWSETGVMPGGLTLNGATGTISGIPTTAQSVPITVFVTDHIGATANKLITIVVAPSTGSVPSFNKIVVVTFENRGVNELIAASGGQFASAVPYLNSLVSQGAYFSQCYGEQHPSQTNYYALFSGATQGITADTCPPPGAPYTTSSLGGELIAAGKGFAGYGEMIPTGGPLVCTDAFYDPGHCPWLRFPSSIPISSNHDFSTFPTTTAGYAALPALSFVAPASPPGHDMEGTVVADVTAGDTWLRQFFDPYLTWARANNSLLIVTFDEDQGHLVNAKPLPGGPLGSPIGGGHVATIFAGANVKTGVYPEAAITNTAGVAGIDHYNVCATIAAALGITPPGTIGSTAALLTDCWSTLTGPTAALTVTPSSGAVPLAVIDDASGSIAGSDPITNYSFVWGDGTPSTSGSSKTAGHTYTVAGSYTTTVTVTDSASLTSQASASVRAGSSSTVPQWDHVVYCMLENHGYTDIIGDTADCPYINNTLVPGGASFSQMAGENHPSFPNYLAAFSGSKQGTTNDNCPPPGSLYSAANLYTALQAVGFNFINYIETLPANFHTTCTNAAFPGLYAGRHTFTPWFSNVPDAASVDFSHFPTDFTTLPPVCMISPNLSHDMHSFGSQSDAQNKQDGDTFVRSSLGTFVAWAAAHNSLFILSWDEDGPTTTTVGGPGGHIPTIFYGAHVKPGVYPEAGYMNHYNILRTICDSFGAAAPGAAATAAPILDCWQ